MPDLNPLISVLLPVYNGEKYISESLMSCMNQTYDNIEIIIVNDCSTDDTSKIIEKYAEMDSRIKIVNNFKNKQLPASLNIAHSEAKGDFITWTSDDNIYHKDAVSKMYEKLIGSESDIVYCEYLIIDDSGSIVNQSHLKNIEHLLFHGVVGACFLYRKEVFIRNSGYNENLVLIEDYDFWLCALKHSSYSKIEIPGYYLYRYHKNSLTIRMKTNQDLKNKFIRNLEKMYTSFFDDPKIKDKKSLVNFFVNRFLEGPYQNIEIIKSKHFFKDLENSCNSFVGFSFEKLKRIIIEDCIEGILRDKKYQKTSYLIALHSQGIDHINRLPIKRYFALLKKCLL